MCTWVSSKTTCILQNPSLISHAEYVHNDNTESTHLLIYVYECTIVPCMYPCVEWVQISTLECKYIHTRYIYYPETGFWLTGNRERRLFYTLPGPWGEKLNVTIAVLKYCFLHLTLLVAGSWLPLLVAGGGGGCLGPPLDISGSYRSIFKIQTAFVSPQHDLHF